MKKIFCVTVALLFLGTSCAKNNSEQTLQGISTQYNIERVGFFYIGGENISRQATGIMGDTDDYIRAHQISVLYLTPANTTSKAPVVMLPGFGITAETYLETPDGRPGWAMDFVRKGYPVYIVEPSHTSRSGIDSGFYLTPNPDGTPRQLFTWGGKQVWLRWGLGPEYGTPFPDGRFDTKYYDQVVSSFTAIETDRIDGARQIEYRLESTVGAVVDLLEKTGPATLLVHSAAGIPAFEIIRRHPELVNAIINVEPLGCPGDNPETIQNVAFLSVFGDHMEVRPEMPARQKACQKTVNHVKTKGLPAKMLDLPKMGIKGNSHLMMMENNSADIAAMMMQWLATVEEK